MRVRPSGSPFSAPNKVQRPLLNLVSPLVVATHTAPDLSSKIEVTSPSGSPFVAVNCSSAPFLKRPTPLFDPIHKLPSRPAHSTVTAVSVPVVSEVDCQSVKSIPSNRNKPSVVATHR